MNWQKIQRSNLRWVVGFILIFSLASTNFKIDKKPAHFAAITNISPIPAMPTISSESSKSISDKLAKLPLDFEANQGQYDSRVKYFSRLNGYNLFLLANEMIFSMPDNGQSLSMRFIDANPDTQLQGEHQLAGKCNYYLSNNRSRWRNDISIFEKVAYKNIYPGIDLVDYGNHRELEYDLIVQPGADPNKIRIAFQGEDQLTIDSQGDLQIQLGENRISKHKPTVYQQVDGKRVMRKGNYRILENNEVAFEIDHYDLDRALIIDPVIAYSSYLGGSNQDGANGIAVDPAGNIYITGKTNSSDLMTAKPFQQFFAGGPSDVFVAKVSADGSTLLFSTYLGGEDSDVGLGITIDPASNIYVVGNTSSNNFPLVNPAQGKFGGNFDGFVAKLTSDGGLLYSTYLGGNSSDGAFNVAADISGNAYVTGSTFSSDFPTTKGALQEKYNGANDAFVVKYDTVGNVIYSTFLGGNDIDQGIGIACDASGNAYVTGLTISNNFPTRQPMQGQCNNCSTMGDTIVGDAFIAKLNADGSALVYSTYLGGSANDFGRRIAVDNAGNAIVLGQSGSSDFPILNSLQSSFGGGESDAVICKIDTNGNMVFSTYFGGNDTDSAAGLALDNAGNIYITGSTSSTNFPNVTSTQSANGGATDAYVAKFNAAGNSILFSTYLGGSDNETSGGIAIDPLQNIYIAGSTSSTNFPIVNGFQPVANMNGEAFVTKFINDTDYELVFNPFAISVMRGKSSQFTLTINRIGGFNGKVTVSTPDTKMLKAKIAPTMVQTTDSSLNFSVKIKKKSPPGVHLLPFKGVDDRGRIRTAILTLNIQ